MSGSRARLVSRRVGAIFVLATAGYHAYLAFGGEGDVPRHVLFVAINVTFAAALVASARVALVLALPLTVQQLISHGGDFVRSICEGGDWDLASLVVCLFFLALDAILVASVVAERPKS